MGVLQSVGTCATYPLAPASTCDSRHAAAPARTAGSTVRVSSSVGSCARSPSGSSGKSAAAQARRGADRDGDAADEPSEVGHDLQGAAGIGQLARVGEEQGDREGGPVGEAGDGAVQRAARHRRAPARRHGVILPRRPARGAADSPAMVLSVLSGPVRERTAVRAALAGRPLTGHRAPAGKAGDVAEIGRLAGLAVATGSRLLHAHGADGAWHTWKAAGSLGCRFGISVQGPEVLVRSRDDARMRGALVFARLVVVPSQFLADAVLGRAVPHERVHVVPPGVPLGPEPTPRSNPVPVVAFTGPFDAQSGVLDAAAVLRELPVVARFAGSGPLLAEVRALGVEVVETDDPAVQRSVLDGADLAVTAGRSTDDGDAEAWGRTAVEAAAAGLPVVATRNGGLPQWVSREGTVLVPSHGDVRSSLGHALADLLARPSDWAAMGRAGREHVREHLEVGARTAELEQLWEGLRRRGPLAGALVRPPDQF